MTIETEIGKAFLGVGRVHVRPYGSAGKFRFVGNVSEITPSHKLDVQKQKDYTRLGGGTATKVSRIDSVDLAMTWLSFSPENMEVAVAGDSAAVEGATITDEVIKGYVGATVPLAHPPMSITTVKNSAGSTTYDPYDPETDTGDYEMSAAGLRFPDVTSIVDAADLEITYVHDDYVKIEAATRTDREVEIMVEGLNEAQAGNPVVGNYWRVNVPAANELATLGDKLGEMKFAAECLKDSTKGSGVSAFYRLRQVTPA